MRLSSALALATGASLLAACGSGGFPDPGPCPPPTPIAIREGASSEEIAFAYRRAVINGLDRIEELADGFTARWPERELRNRSEFRTEFVAFAHAARCEAAGLNALEPPPFAEQYHAELTAQMQELSRIMDDGLDAVRARNVSEFRRWDRRERAFRAEAVPALRQSLP
ncbi:MAG: hypothetical protein Kow0010_13960 [Dehalococcoidia bacterium]